MTLGERIKRIRTFRHMTQKELGIKCGFSENTADVRIRQYESNSKIPKNDTLQVIAKALSVNERALGNYDSGCTEDILETLFWLEEATVIELFNFQKEYSSEEDWLYKASYNDFHYTNSIAPTGFVFSGLLINDFIAEWFLRYQELKRNDITYDEYFDWKLNWPLSCDEQKGHKDYYTWRKK